VLPTDPIRPLHDVWLRPRRVFRELATLPIGRADYLLGAAQGIVSWLALSRAQSAGSDSSIGEILGKAVVIGPIAGLASLFLMAAIYARLGKRAGGVATRSHVFHVLAYGGVPTVASLAVWFVTMAVAGSATFVETQPADADGFIVLLLRAQFIAYLLLMLWSVLLQVMGLSEVQGFAVRKAFGLWMLGQLVGFLAMLLLAVSLAMLLPNVIGH
jgi:hypothetical protein